MLNIIHGLASLLLLLPSPPAVTTFSLVGLTSPATVTESIFLYAAPPAGTVSVAYYVDDVPVVTATRSPFWMGSPTGGYSLDALSPGTHRLRAVANMAGGRTAASNLVTMTVVPSINGQFSASLAPYANQVSAQQKGASGILANTTTPRAVLSAADVATRTAMVEMYMNWGIDLSLDAQHDQSTVLLGLVPTGWALPAAPVAGVPLSMLFSPDAPFYHPIPTAWPETALPAGYFKVLQLNTVQGGDGIGFGETVAAATDPSLLVRSQWYEDVGTSKAFPFPMPAAWSKSLPAQPAGDMHMVFVDPLSRRFVSTYKTSLDPATGGPDALAASEPIPLATLGDHGGSIAAGFAELPVLLQPGEATDPVNPIRHALGGSVARTWAARVFPANAWDGNVKTSINTCTHLGYTNTGLVPYGGVIQLDPTLNLAALKLTLPALRILQAIQTYGYYVMDFGCADIDLYTSIPEAELDPFGGLWGYNKLGLGVQNEVATVLLNSRLYVVAPLTKKQ